jgi:hypothetical protein
MTYDQSNPLPGQVTVSSGDSVSTVFSVPGGYTICGLEMPTAWTSAASITLQSSLDGTTFMNLYDMFGSEVTIVADASRTILLNSGDLWSCRYVKLRSGTSGTPVLQGADRVIKVIIR